MIIHFQIIRKFGHLIKMNIKYLYKYRSMSSKCNERIFTHNEIYFPSPSEFNDPFDCKIQCTMNGSDEDFKKFYGDIIKDQYPLWNQAKRTGAVLEIINSEMHRNPEYHKSNTQKAIELYTSPLGVFCLSAVNDNILMWSHYCYGHTGFCIEFEVNEKTIPFKDAKPVLYPNQYPIIDYFSATDQEKLNGLLFTKSKHWSYEKEWRIVFDEKGKNTFDEEALTGVIFGCRMNEHDQDKIRGWLHGKSSAVKLYKTKIKDMEFGLDIQELKEK